MFTFTVGCGGGKRFCDGDNVEIIDGSLRGGETREFKARSAPTFVRKCGDKDLLLLVPRLTTIDAAVDSCDNGEMSLGALSFGMRRGERSIRGVGSGSRCC